MDDYICACAQHLQNDCLQGANRDYSGKFVVSTFSSTDSFTTNLLFKKVAGSLLFY